MNECIRQVHIYPLTAEEDFNQLQIDVARERKSCSKIKQNDRIAMAK